MNSIDHSCMKIPAGNIAVSERTKKGNPFILFVFSHGSELAYVRSLTRYRAVIKVVKPLMVLSGKRFDCF